MTDATFEADIAVPHRGRGRPKDQTSTLTKAARARFDTLAAESIEAVFQAVLTAATQDGDMAAPGSWSTASSRLAEGVVPHPAARRRQEHAPWLMPTCSTMSALAGWTQTRPRPSLPSSRSVPSCSYSARLASRDRSLKAQLAVVVGRPPPTTHPPPVRDHLTEPPSPPRSSVGASRRPLRGPWRDRHVGVAPGRALPRIECIEEVVRGVTARTACAALKVGMPLKVSPRVQGANALRNPEGQR